MAGRGAARARGAVSVLPAADVISLARGIPSPDMFPLELLAECARRAVEVHGRTALNYGPPAGFQPLREWVGARHGVDPGRVLLTPGSMIGLNLAVGRLVGRGDAAIVEAPTYDRVLQALRSVGGEVVAVRRDAGGLDLDALRAAATATPRPTLLYVLPTFHNPTGRTLTLEQRHGLAELALELGLPVLEDDPYGLLRVEGEPLPHVHELLRGLGGDHLALFASSFSKSVAPGLRVGYLLLPEALVAPLAEAALNAYVSPPLLPQAQLFEFLAAGHLEPHLESARAFLRVRRDTLIGVLAEEIPAGVTWTRPEGGYFLWIDLPAGLDATALAVRAQAAGVVIVPGAGFFADGAAGSSAGAGGRSSARLAFSFPSVEDVREGARRLSRLVREAVGE